LFCRFLTLIEQHFREHLQFCCLFLCGLLPVWIW